MNIFFLDNEPRVIAQSYHDSHLRKIIVEVTQMLSTACHYHYIVDYYKYKPDEIRTIKIEDNKYKINNKEYVDVPKHLKRIYKSTHVNHPMTKWVRDTFGNFNYTKILLNKLLMEYLFRFNKKHKCREVFNELQIPDCLSENCMEMKDPPQCMPEKYINNDYIQAYRDYYIGKKLRDKNGKIAKWTKREKPEFIKNVDNNIFDYLKNAYENKILQNELNVLKNKMGVENL